MSKTLQKPQYEPLTFSVEITSEDLPREDDESLHDYMTRIHFKAYGQILRFQCVHGDMTCADAKEEMKNFVNFYRKKSE